jgi:crotonobetainyl-CoA:carnitine CoA-transferase CaiB-like acyl-CoA transferase
MTTNVMEGIRILEVAEHTFVPAASAILSDWGAEVIKIEHVERGDAMRGLMKTGLSAFESAVPVILEHSNRGKKSLGLDLSAPDGLDILYKLAATCDVFLTNKMPGVRSRLKIDIDDIAAQNPNIIYAAGTGYGSQGPEGDAGGYDFLGFWARAGCALGSTPSNIEGLVSPPAPGYGDSIGAMTIAGGICAALLHRERTGEATPVEVSLLGTGMWSMGAAIALSQHMDFAWMGPPVGGNGTPSNPLIGQYQTSDGKWLAFSMLQGFDYWPEMCERIGRPDLVEDERFNSVEKLMENAPAAADILAEVLKGRTQAEWKAVFSGMRGQWSPVQDTLDLAQDPQVVANGYLQEAESSGGVKFEMVATPVQFGGEPSPTRRGPEFNEHGDEILAEELGLDWDAIIDLKTRGVVA